MSNKLFERVKNEIVRAMRGDEPSASVGELSGITLEPLAVESCDCKECDCCEPSSFATSSFTLSVTTTECSETQFAADVRNELASARKAHPTPVRSVAEGYGILAEEFREFELEAFKKERDASALLAELIQVGAMAQRIADDLGLSESAIARQR